MFSSRSFAATSLPSASNSKSTGWTRIASPSPMTSSKMTMTLKKKVWCLRKSNNHRMTSIMGTCGQQLLQSKSHHKTNCSCNYKKSSTLCKYWRMNLKRKVSIICEQWRSANRFINKQGFNYIMVEKPLRKTETLNSQSSFIKIVSPSMPSNLRTDCWHDNWGFNYCKELHLKTWWHLGD